MTLLAAAVWLNSATAAYVREREAIIRVICDNSRVHGSYEWSCDIFSGVLEWMEIISGAILKWKRICADEALDKTKN